MEPWVAQWDGPRPRVHPVRTPAGALVSCDAPADHPWHHGLWFTIKYLNGENFWEEYDAFGTLESVAVEPDGAGGWRATIDWVRPGGRGIAARDTRTITPRAIDDDSYALDWDVTVTPLTDTLFDRTPFTTWGGYGGLTLRGAPDWVDTELVLPDGMPRERTLGDRAPWCSLQGRATRADGKEGIAGVAIFDHPENIRHPSPWYGSTRADTYGEGWANFLNAAFLWDEPLACATGEPLRLRYRVLVHDGARTAHRLAAAYDAWIGE
jgi:hypothetical protein